MIDERDKSIIGLIQGDLPLEKRPFEKMADLGPPCAIRRRDLARMQWSLGLFRMIE